MLLFAVCLDVLSKSLKCCAVPLENETWNIDDRL